MENGMIIAQKTDRGYTEIHLDEDVVNFARLNRLTKGRLAETAKAQRKEQDAAAQRQNHMERRRRAAVRATWRMVKAVVLMAIIGAALVWGVMASLVSPLWAVPALAICIAVATYQIGLWMGRKHRKENK